MVHGQNWQKILIIMYNKVQLSQVFQQVRWPNRLRTLSSQWTIVDSNPTTVITRYTEVLNLHYILNVGEKKVKNLNYIVKLHVIVKKVNRP